MSVVWQMHRTLQTKNNPSVSLRYIFAVFALLSASLKCQNSVAVFTTLIGLKILSRIEPRFQNWNLRRNFHLEDLLTDVILRVRLGSGLRRSLLELSQTKTWQREPGRELLQLTLDWMTLGGESGNHSVKRPDIIAAAREFLSIDGVNHQVLQALLSWRARLIMLNQMKSRVQQVSHQIRLQSVFAILIYGGAAALHLFSGELFRLGWLLPFSLMLLCLGVTLIFRLGRKVKWSF